MFTSILKNKVIIVTGGTGLIGKHIVESAEASGAIVINVDISNHHDIESGKLNLDITTEFGIQDLLDAVILKYGRIDGLVNNAYPRTADWGNKVEDIKFNSWQKNIDLQMNSVFLLCQKTLEIMKEQNSGSIVNIASIYGVVGNDFTLYEEYGGTSPAAYAAIKGGIVNLTRYLASYFGKYNIRVNCVSPGGVLDAKQQHPSFIENYSKKSPLKRLANPEEIAPSVIFLLSDLASYITGHNLMVDGGWTAI
ncbi:SDR family oxidoreductase [Kaistella jeonii]|uniref:Short-chain dehydrogenase n=1 Tax=Kaistella jeonii TaxID=266749 RepID=A0A0C1D5W0_9FLAO|nr:SDR family oxidoreductase [Kaistella jeonii]KIA89120.1 short-chain dehydrogenase [Kaistella jeonii]SFB93894.1 NAD(P)-dependent dehydrogenase, short-chain alcohol dehydrogenase family [Kaistella jeonii]VEI97065.1 Levodione reductase [Kaistella jeonii]